MKLLANEEFINRAGGEIEKLKETFKKELETVSDNKIRNGYVKERERKISYYNDVNSNGDIIGRTIKIKNNNDTYFYLFSSSTALEAILCDNNNYECQKYSIYLDNGDVKKVTSLFKVDDYITIDRNLTKNSTLIKGTINKLEYDPNDDDMTYLRKCFKKQKIRVR